MLQTSQLIIIELSKLQLIGESQISHYADVYVYSVQDVSSMLFLRIPFTHDDYYALNPNEHFFIFLKDDKQKPSVFIGSISFIFDNDLNGYILSYWIAKNHQKKGYATQAVGEFLHSQIKDNAQINVFAYIQEENKDSQHFLQNLPNFSFEKVSQSLIQTDFGEKTFYLYKCNSRNELKK